MPDKYVDHRIVFKSGKTIELSKNQLWQLKKLLTLTVHLDDGLAVELTWEEAAELFGYVRCPGGSCEGGCCH